MRDATKPRRKSTLRRGQILQAAEKLFEERGFEATTLETIADAIGMRRQGIYYYYRSRTEILIDLLRPLNEDLVANLRTIVASGGDPRDQLRAAVNQHIRMVVRTARSGVEFSAIDRQSSGKEVDNALHDLFRDYRGLWQVLLETGTRAGLFELPGAPTVVIFGILGMLNFAARWYNQKGSLTLDALADSYATLLCKGLAAADATDKPKPAPGVRRRQSGGGNAA